MSKDASLEALIDALRALPGVGVKSATRMAYHLLSHDRPAALRMALALQQAVERIGHCQRCHTFTEHPVCELCRDPQRDASKLCVVESAADQSAIERTGTYRGLYFVLLGRLSPMDGIGPREIGLDHLIVRATEPVVQELVIATNFTAEGEATAHAISQLMKNKACKITRLARGVPIGSELEYVDLGTIAHAFQDRR